MFPNEKQVAQSLISMSFSVMAGLVPAIHAVPLARSSNA
jgi:hypothetical protein